MNFNKIYLWLLIPIAIVIYLIVHTINQSELLDTKSNQILALTDSVRLYKTKSGASGAEKQIFVGTKTDALNVLKGKDSTAYNTVKNTSGIHSYSDFTNTTKVDTVVKLDTVYMSKDSTGKLVVNFSKEIKEPKGFYDAKIDVKNDSVGLQLSLNDKYHVVTKDKSNGFFKPKSYVVTVENENPYVKINGLQSFEIQPQNKQIGLKIGTVALVGLGAFLLFHK